MQTTFEIVYKSYSLNICDGEGILNHQQCVLNVEVFSFNDFIFVLASVLVPNSVFISIPFSFSISSFRSANMDTVNFLSTTTCFCQLFLLSSTSLLLSFLLFSQFR